MKTWDFFFCIILFDFQCYVFIVVWKLVQIYSTGENAFWKTVIDCKQLDCKKRSTWSSKSIIIKHPANIVIQLCWGCLISTVVTDCKPLPWISFLDLGIPTFISSMVLYNINHDNLTAKDNWSSRQYRHSGTRRSVPQSDFSGKEFIRVFDWIVLPTRLKWTWN